MEKTGMTALDLKFLVPELRASLEGGRFRKIYQYGRKSKQFVFVFFVPGKGELKLYVDSSKIFITSKKDPVPQEPPSFCMFLRKHLMGTAVERVRQHGFDRIVEIETRENKLIFEMFPPGNVILVNSMNSIIMPMEIQRWKDREIKPKTPYRYPPALPDPFELDTDQLTRSLKNSNKGLAAYLATTLGFGGLYGEEICKAVKLPNDTPAKSLNLEQTTRLRSTFNTLSTMRLIPRVYDNTVSPFGLESCKGEVPQRTDTFSQALDIFFSAQKLELKKEEKRGADRVIEERVERISNKQDKAQDKWERIEKGSKETADLIYKHYTTVQAVLDGIKKANEQGIPWNKIKEVTKTEDTPEARAIKEIRENDAIVVVDLEGKALELDFRLTVEENAARCYEDSKWAKKKLTGLEKSRDIVMKKLGAKSTEPDASAPEDKTKEKPAPPKPRKKRGKWYEKYKWFVSSDGFLVVAGRNARQNDMLLTKYAEQTDIVYHADIPGAAFVVIRGEGREVPEATIKEAAEFSAANSKAWSRGLGSMDVFCTKRSQVSKPGGLPKGSWVVSGERVWFRKQELRLAIGVKVDEEARVLYGPVFPIRKSTDYFVTVIPGGKSSTELARTIKNKILIKARPEHKPLIEKVLIEDIEKTIPSGTGDVVEFC